MYLIHLPVPVGFEILLVSLDWPIVIKLGADLGGGGSGAGDQLSTCWSGPPRSASG